MKIKKKMISSDQELKQVLLTEQGYYIIMYYNKCIARDSTMKIHWLPQRKDCQYLGIELNGYWQNK